MVGSIFRGGISFYHPHTCYFIHRIAQSFEIFNHIEVKSPVVFTTSYDEFALKAFKVNSVHYLLKPIPKEELEAALNKYKQLKSSYSSNNTTSDVNIESIVKEFTTKTAT